MGDSFVFCRLSLGWPLFEIDGWLPLGVGVHFMVYTSVGWQSLTRGDGTPVSFYGSIRLASGVFGVTVSRAFVAC